MDKVELESLFSIAITRENEAYEFYKDVSSKVQSEDVKKVFQQLADEEMSHAEILEKFKHDPTVIMKFVAPERDFKIAEATELPTLSTDMKPADAIALAMKKEQQAVEFYLNMSDQTDDKSIKKIFENLANMELNHKHRLENVFVEIGYPEVF